MHLKTMRKKEMILEKTVVSDMRTNRRWFGKFHAQKAKDLFRSGLF